MPCPYWFRLCVPLTAVSGRPVSQSVTNSILTASRLCYAVSGVYVQSMPFGVPLSRRRFIDCLHDTIRRAVCQQVFFAFSCILWLPDPVLSYFPNFSASFSLPYFIYQCFFRIIIIFQTEEKKRAIYRFSIC
nr:MAG TPA: hypothetical protein [Caudoviricetes sp.]